ncbi:MAG: YdcF family protein [Clostridia bacterium]|nr:YdcF family protein [Clostridia bacterium]
MKYSSVTEKFLLELTPEQKWELICGGVRDDGESADVALLLGTRPEIAAERALAAAELYRQGRVKYIVPSGGVKWDVGNGEMQSEAEYMSAILIREGVPPSAIIIENEATTTKENMIYGALQINRKTKFYGDKRVIIVTSQSHMKRSIALAKTFLPRMVRVSAYPSFPAETREEWLKNEENLRLLDSFIHLTKGLVDHGIIEDEELNI